MAEIEINISQHDNGIVIAGTKAPVNMTVNQTGNKEDKKLCSSDESVSMSDDASQKKDNDQKEWPDPKQFTIATVWERKDGTFCLKTNTNGQRDGRVEFPKTTKQMQLMMLLCYKYPKSISLSEILEEIYQEKKESLEENPENVIPSIRRACSLVSSIQKKLAKSNINPDIISPLKIAEITKQKTVSLLVKHLNRLDQGMDKEEFEVNRFDQYEIPV